jgi:hypothetical protein
MSAANTSASTSEYMLQVTHWCDLQVMSLMTPLAGKTDRELRNCLSAKLSAAFTNLHWLALDQRIYWTYHVQPIGVHRQPACVFVLTYINKI